MADTYTTGDITANTTWSDLTATYAPMVGVSSWVQNKSGVNILVAYSSSASAPTGGGMLVPLGAIVQGTANHVWVRSITGTAKVAVGLTD